MNEEINYQNLYLTHYKNIPNKVFVSTFISVTLAAVVAGIITLSNYSIVGISIILGGALVAWLLAHINRFIASVAISQKVVVADALLSMQNTNTAPIIDDELPEL